MRGISIWPTRTSQPTGLKWRSSYWFVTFVVGMGIAVDLLVYSIIIPVLPFQLQRLGYDNVSSLTAWLLFAYSGGLVFSTIPVAMFSERYNARQYPLVLGIIVLIGSQIMLMEAPTYWLMCLSRVLQGIGSTMVWVVGMALLCDSTPPSFVGRQLGTAMIGLTLGFLIGPVVGGVLYNRFGFRGPFIFGIAGAVLDLMFRLIVIERKDALRWGHDPAASPPPQFESEARGQPEPPVSEPNTTPVRPDVEKGRVENVSPEVGTKKEDDPGVPAKPLSLVAVLVNSAGYRIKGFDT